MKVAAITLASLLGSAPCAAAGPPARAGAAGPPFIVHRQVEAEVSQVDRAAGVLLLKTDAGRLKLQAPADAGGILRKGDRVLVHVTVVRHPDPARIPRSAPPPGALLVRRLAAEVVAIQRSLGIVALRTPAGRLNVDLPSAAIVGLGAGARLPLELALVRDTEGAALARMEKRNGRAGLAALLLGIFGRTPRQAP
jgi:hypothetical protein